MLINTIKDKGLRDLANKRSNQCHWDFTDELGDAFDWDETDEGRRFWQDVDNGIRTELKPNVNNASHNALEEIRESYALQDVAMASRFSLSDLKEIQRRINNVEKVKRITALASRYRLELNEVVNIVNEVNR
jgi:hypothetical protein